MSTEPEASEFEQALRADVPSAETEARLRRRLLAAGLAIGNGMATTGAAAAGTATTGAGSGGLVANAVGLSWGVKLGFAAAVAIPTVGLLMEASDPEPRAAVGAVSAAAPARVSAAPLPIASALPTSPAAEPVREPEPSRTKPNSGSVGRREPAAADVERAVIDAPTAPSQATFAAAAPEPPAARPSQSTLGEETRLLDAAFAELAAGNRARAAQLIAEHEARYPRGLLSKERERAKTRLSELSRGQ